MSSQHIEANRTQTPSRLVQVCHSPTKWFCILTLSFQADKDDYVVYPDVDRDEDVVYAYHAVNDK